MRARFVGPDPVNLQGVVDGSDVSVTANAGEILEISDAQKQLIEESDTHVLVPPAPRPLNLTEEWDKDELSVRRSKVRGLVRIDPTTDWFLIPKPDEPEVFVSPERHAAAVQQNRDRQIAFAAELEAKRAKDEAKPKPGIKGAMHTTTEAEALAAEKAKEDKKR